ncbi:bifunctional phosphatase PAP2/diacylglycerol kinase family protein [Microcella sp.]|uniref:bifunctional phosphatase PAP2/diacylglycerol kinase family protein n=1 Tax=Microcella sp. TaxID=1913979 RepID=UPI00391B5310
MARFRAPTDLPESLDRAAEAADEPSLVASPVRRRQVLPRWVHRADRAMVRHLHRGEYHPGVDRGLRMLSRAADRGMLWFGIASSLAAAGRWRAGIRGIASLLTASAVTNLIGKRVFGGERPDHTLLPVVRRIRAMPTSPSFPSGHSASAAAFAAGVALERPVAGAVVVPVAAAVCYSRVHTGAHWPSDVVGGAAIGLAAAGASALVARTARSGRRVAGPAAPSIPLPPLADGRGLVIIVNPGSGLGGDPSAELRRRLPHARLIRTSPGADPAALARKAVRRRGWSTAVRALGVSGGDGTVSAIAHVAREAELPLAVFPTGTRNAFARTAGLASVADTARAIVDGSGLHVDVAEVRVGDGPAATAINTVSLGVYPQLVDARARAGRRLGKVWGALVAVPRVLKRSEPFDVEVDGRAARVWSVFIGVNDYRTLEQGPLWRGRLDDGALDVRILHAGRRRRRTALSMTLLGGRPRRADAAARTPAFETFHAREVRVELRDPAGRPGFAKDGEASVDPLTGAVTVRILPRGLRIYAPH